MKGPENLGAEWGGGVVNLELYIDILGNGFIQIYHLIVSYLELVSPLSQDERRWGVGEGGEYLDGGPSP